jgi:hypothetical protein
MNESGETNLEILKMLTEQKHDNLRVETKRIDQKAEEKANVKAELSREPSVGTLKEEPSPNTAATLAMSSTTTVAPLLAQAPDEAQKIFGKLPPELSKNLSKPQAMRLSVIYEMIETEADYIRDMNIMINVRILFQSFILFSSFIKSKCAIVESLPKTRSKSCFRILANSLMPIR